MGGSRCVSMVSKKEQNVFSNLGPQCDLLGMVVVCGRVVAT